MGEIIARNMFELIEIVNKIITDASSWLFMLLNNLVYKNVHVPWSELT